jgi:hypothetical protein
MNSEFMPTDLDPRQLEREERIVQAVSNTLSRRRDALRLQVPVDLERSIRIALGEAASAKNQSWYADALNWLRRPAVSFGMAAATLMIVVSLVFISQKPESLPSEITDAALMAFPGVHSGSTKLDVTTSDRGALSAYLAEHGVEHEIFYPEVEAELVGANVFSVNGLPCAEIVYKAAGHTIALLQVDEKALASKRVELHPVVAEDVAHSKWHWASTADNGTLFVWKSNSIMCTVVSDLQIDEVSSLFRLEAL